MFSVSQITSSSHRPYTSSSFSKGKMEYLVDQDHSVENSSNGLIFRKKGQKWALFQPKNGRNLKHFQEKKGRFQAFLFIFPLKYL